MAKLVDGPPYWLAAFFLVLFGISLWRQIVLDKRFPPKKSRGSYLRDHYQQFVNIFWMGTLVAFIALVVSVIYTLKS